MDTHLFKSDTVSSNRILYTPSSFAKSSLMYLQEIGSLTAHLSHVSSRSNLHSYLFFVVRSGAGELVYDGVKYDLGAGSCVFIDCDIPYSHTTFSDNLWQLSWIHFQGEMISSIYDKYVSRGGKPVFIPQKIDDFIDIYNELFSVASSADYIRDMRINSLLNQLLVLLMAESWHPVSNTDGRQKRSMLCVKIYLDEHFTDKIGLDDLAAQFFINKFYLVKSFKQQYGMSINNYLRNLRVTKAKKMLRFTGRKVEDIGVECGLGALTYFSRTFKKVEGISPSEYRGQWNGIKSQYSES